MAENLTSKQLLNWQKSVDTAISKNLVTSLQKANADAVQLNKVTSSGQDENNLSYRFKDLSKVTEQASKQLNTFMKAFDSNLTTYIKTVKTTFKRKD